MYTEENKQQAVDTILDSFDFKFVASFLVLTKEERYWQTEEELRKTAKKLLNMCMKHTDTDYWWARTGCFYALWEEMHGLTLFFTPLRKRFNFSDEFKTIEKA